MRRRHLSTGIMVAVALAISACGSSGDSTESDATTAAVETGTETGTETAATTAAVETETETETGTEAVVGEPGPICDSIPSLDVLSSIIGEPVTTAADNSTPTVEIDGDTVIGQRCDVGGDGIASIVFERVDLATGAGLLDEIDAQGLAIDRPYPDLPGATAWANGLLIEHDGLFWSATAYTTSTVGQLDAPAAYDASAAVLSAWIDG